MTYLQSRRQMGSHSKGRKVRNIFLVLFVMLVISFFFYYSGSSSASLALKVVSPVVKVFKHFYTNIDTALKLFEPKPSLISENEVLKKENESLKIDLFDYELVIKENNRLREILDLREENLLIAAPILSPPQVPYDTIIIDRGIKDGLFSGFHVLSSHKTLLGYIEEVFDSHSKVRLYSSAGIKTPAVHELTGTAVELLGKGGGEFVLEAPLGFDIEEGDIFLVPGLSSQAVAVAVLVKKDESSSFITILLRSPHEISGDTTLLIEVK